ncbi:MAG TPA: FKBP-type peptidyl-prolyl cis-trans isomerase [Jatrophihabitantaceae bacterium]
MPTNKQRREAARRHLERQLERRQQREASRKRTTLIATIAGTVVLAVVVVVVVIALTNDNKKANANSTTTPTASATPSATPSPTPSTSYPPAKGAAVSFKGVTVKGAADLAGAPGVTSKSAKAPTKLEYKDLVVGKGEAATPTSTVTVQYSGVLYKTGKAFDSSWSRGQPAQFSLAQVVKGFTQGIGGTSGVSPMKAGGRRIIIIPASLGYGAQAQGPIPANSPLVFVVDLKSVSTSG